MSRDVAVLRAVNVGGRVVKMDILKSAFESLGVGRVETSIARLAGKFAVPGRRLAIWLVLAGLLTSSPAAEYAEHADRGSSPAADYAEHADTRSSPAAEYAEHADRGSSPAADYAEHADTRSSPAAEDAEHADRGSSPAADYAEHADTRSSPAAEDAGHADTRSSQAAQTRPHIVDLGHPITATDPTWDGKPAFERSVVATFDKDGYTAGKIVVEEHFGTHLDAPAHFAKDGWTVDRIPVDRLYRPGVCINVTAQAAKDPDYRVTRADIAAFEARHGVVPEGSVVLIATGWDRFWSDHGRYMNDRDGVKHFPGLSVEAVTYLAKERRVAGIGIDTPSIDYGPSTAFEAHKVSMGLGVYHIENAAHLTPLPETGFMVVVAPIDIAGGSGGPTRLFALLR
jgi:kynurenine formamidase